MKEDVKLSNQQRAQVLGLYIGGKARYKNEFGTYETIIDGLFIGKYMATGIDFKIILTPLSEITDEDKREVAELTGFPFDNMDIILRGGADIDNTLIDEWLLAIDFLRSRGYMLPYMGIDLYEAGIAIKPTILSPSQA